MRNVLYTALFVLMTAGSVVLIRIVGLQIPAMLMVFLTTSYSILIFHALTYRDIGSVYRKILSSSKMVYFQLNIALLVGWAGTFLIPIYFTPSALLVSSMSISSLGGSLSSYLKTRRRSDLVECCLLAANLVLFYILYANQYHGWKYVSFVASTAVVGVALYASLRLFGYFHDNGFTALQISAIRFWALWVISLSMVISQGEFAVLTPKAMLYTAALGLVSMVLPLYFLQRSIGSLGSDKTGILVGFTPIVAIILERLVHDETTIFDAVPAILLPVIILTFLVYGRVKMVRHGIEPAQDTALSRSFVGVLDDERHERDRILGDVSSDVEDAAVQGTLYHAKDVAPYHD